MKAENTPMVLICVRYRLLIAIAEEKIHGKEIDLEMLEGFFCLLSFECEAPLCLSVVAVGCAIGYGFSFALVCEAPMCLIRIAVGNAVSGFWQFRSVVAHIEFW
ncbi:hypothetical protein Tco_0861109 [Tanacetum coccineum]|uniref:Uncharacterized protein n=1 Tax=Tanacetum coccineum TaxID=301880 RepID=A0ABQ5BJX2_9ASTR